MSSKQRCCSARLNGVGRRQRVPAGEIGNALAGADSIGYRGSMRSTANFRRQHEEILALAEALADDVDGERIGERAAALRIILARLAGKLRVHARMEEEALYPRLLTHEDPAIRGCAARMQTQFGPVYGAFEGYLSRWPTASSIELAPAAFARETLAVVALLGKRIERETRELYPLADAAG